MVGRYFVYILESLKSGRYYVGYAADVEERLEYHNRGATRSTRGWRPWRIAYIESHSEKRDAMKREREIKRMKSRRYIRKLVEDASDIGA